MNKFLNIVLKGLLTAFVMIVTGGFIFLNIKTSPSTSMVLVSSSVVNSLRTDIRKEKEDLKVEKVKLEEEVDEIKEEEKKEEPKEEEKKEEVKEEVQEQPKQGEQQPVQVQEQPQQQQQQPSTSNANGNYSPNTEATNGAATNTFSGKMTAYGPDCYGCYGSMTAMGDYVGEGNIYYNHPTYGTIRIVAGDRSILNKVVRISGVNLYPEPIIAIVRDTGGDIGFNKPKGIVLDLLFPSEHSPEAANFGMQWVTVEVLN